MKEKLDYEKMVEYKVRIFETVFPEKAQGAYADNVIDKVLKDVNKIYDNLSQIDNMKITVEVRAKDGSYQSIIKE